MTDGTSNWIMLLLQSINTVGVSVLGFLWWSDFKKGQMGREYRFDVAKETSVLFNQLKSTFIDIRSPIHFAHKEKMIESSYNRAFAEDYDDEMEPFCDSRHIARICYKIHEDPELEEIFERINKLQPKFKTAFHTEEPFRELWRVVSKIKDSARYLDTADFHGRQSSQYNKDEREKHNKIVYWDSDDSKDTSLPLEERIRTDEIIERVNKIIKSVEEICSSALRGREKSTLSTLGSYLTQLAARIRKCC